MYALNNVQWNSKLLKLLKNLKAVYFAKTKCEEMNIYRGKKKTQIWRGVPGEAARNADLALPEEIKIVRLNVPAIFTKNWRLVLKQYIRYLCFTVIQPFSLIMPEKYLRSGSFLNIGAFVSSLNGFQGNRHGYYCIFWNLMWSWVFMNLDKT